MHAESLAKMRGVELAAACDIKPERAKAKAGRYHCAAYTDYKKMLAREALDAVHILTPHYLHMPMALEAARRRINILLEKPMALNPAQAAREVATGRKAGVALSVISQNRFNTGSQLVKKRIKDGSLGKLKAARLILSYHKPDSYYRKSDWKGRKSKEGGGVVIDQAIHYLDILRWLAASPIDYVEAHCARRMHSFIDVEDSAEGVMKFESGFYATFYLINYYSYDDDPRIEIDCEKARVTIVKDSSYIEYFSGKKEKAEPKAAEYIDYGDGVRDYWGVAHCNQIRDFYDSLRAGRPPAITGEDALKTQELVSAIYESSTIGKKVYL
jgi:predicted dehydrogenase